MPITDWPIDERPRERLLKQGADKLTDAELLAIFLRTGIPGKTAVDLARDLLQDSGGLRQLLALERKAFCRRPGLGEAKYALLQAVLEMGRRHLFQALEQGEELSSPRAVRHYLTARLRHQDRELFCCLFLDNRHRVIRCEDLFQGTIDGASVYPREVVKRALALGAAAVIFAHNHPSGVAEPSSADQRLTQRLQRALELVDIRVLDHMVVGEAEVVSFAERGLL
jgi:DNA repair protein RadC